MSEKVRLVIWDLDETFWRGTLTEGGIQEYQQSNHDIIVELACRGIVSSVCSKNNRQAVKAILVQAGIWDYVVFPSIDWSSKGPRIAQIVETTMLRPATVLFVDDNPSNLKEAEHFCPGIQVAGPDALPNLLADWRMVGKDDRDLTRLGQYKLLEAREADASTAKQAGGTAADFLRASNIKVDFEYDVERHIPRAVELVNRTNQLNFTKRRFPEEPEEAAERLRHDLRQPNVQAALIHAEDRYGNYGFIGFYLIHVHTWTLEHFCFSCRTLGMEIETWVYQQLREPRLDIVGDVVTQIVGCETVGWINQKEDGYDQAVSRSIANILLRGGCEMQAISHYLLPLAENVVGEYAFSRFGRPLVPEHSVFLSNAGMTAEQRGVAASLGYNGQDLESAATRSGKAFDAVVLSFWTDAACAIYRHRATGLVVPFFVPGLNNGFDARHVDQQTVEHALPSDEARAHHKILVEQFDYLEWSLRADTDLPDGSIFAGNLRTVLEGLAAQTRVVILLPCEAWSAADGTQVTLFHFRELNRVTRHVAGDFPNVTLLAADAFILGAEDAIDPTHFSRQVYHRIFHKISASITA